MAGAPLGNQNAAKAKRWEAAIIRAIERRANPSIDPGERSDLIKGLDEAADLFVAKMMAENDLGFFKEFADRLDGKSIQQTEVSGRDGAPIAMKTVVNFVGSDGGG